MTDAHLPKKTRFVAALLLWTPWMVSILPLFALFIEFRCRQLGECGTEWWYYARLYSHFFLYPITFGLISTALLHRPWVRTVRHLRSLPEDARTVKICGLVAVRAGIAKIGVITLSALAIIVFASWVEFTRATPALWSFPPDVPSRTGGAGEAEGPSRWLADARTLIQTRCMPKDFAVSDDPKETQSAAESPPLCRLVLSLCPGSDHALCGLVRSYCTDRPGGLDSDAKAEFADALDELKERNYISATERVYYGGFVALTTLFTFLLMAIIVEITSVSETSENRKAPEDGENRESPEDEENRKKKENREKEERQGRIRLLLAALFFASFWVLMRGAFLTEKLTIYPEDPLLELNYLIFLALVALYVHIATTLWRGSKRYEKYLNVLLSIAGVAVGVVGLFKESLSADWVSELLVGLFGTGGSSQTYIGVLLFLLVVYFPNILRSLDGDGRPDDPGRPGAT